MIQKAIVEAIENDYQVKVRIPKYDKMSYDGTNYHELSTGIICSTPGSLVNYSVGDIVLVGFENDEIGKPVVLGLLYTDNNAESTVNFPDISEQLDNVTQSLAKINNANSFLHVKYSNDGGITFTSLYDYSDIITDDNINYRLNPEITININVKSSYLAWNIVDANNVNSLTNFDITTIVTAVKDGIKTSLDPLNDYVIHIPDSFNYMDSLSVSFTITPKSGEITDYNIALFTDMDPIGSIYGDYIGVLYSNSSVASTNPIDYTWMAVQPRVQEFIDSAYKDLLKRIQKNERYLYGKSEEDVTDTNPGLNSALDVSKDIFNISKKNTIELAKNKQSKDNYIRVDTQSIAIVFNDLYLMATNDGHLRLSSNK